MAGTMSEADLLADLKDSLGPTASAFDSEGDTALKRLLAQALPDMAVKRPITKLSSVTLQADVDRYQVQAADFANLKVDLWRNPQKMPKPWDPCWPGALPRVCAQRDEDAIWWIVLDPAPTAQHLVVLGAEFRYYYFGLHTIGAQASDTTVNALDRGLLLVRAQSEAMLALAVRNAGKPVQLRDGLSGTPRNSTPSALHEALMRQFWEAR